MTRYRTCRGCIIFASPILQVIFARYDIKISFSSVLITDGSLTQVLQCLCKAFQCPKHPLQASDIRYQDTDLIVVFAGAGACEALRDPPPPELRPGQ